MSILVGSAKLSIVKGKNFTGGGKTRSLSTLKTLESFFALARSYRVLFFDAYGVLKNSSGIIEGIPAALYGLRKAGIEYFVITNDASRSPDKMSAPFRHPEFGDLLPEDRIVSSGMLAGEFLRDKVRSGRVAYLGKPDSEYYIESAGLVPVPVSKVVNPEEISAMVLMDDEGFDWFEDINRTLNLLRLINVPVVVANTDTAYPVNSEQVAVAVGSLADMIAAVVQKTFIRFGKPDTQIFSFALARARRLLPDLTKRQILMVGDTLQTDILGANKFGLDTALVLSGNTRADRVKLQVRSTGIIPDFVCESILT